MGGKALVVVGNQFNLCVNVWLSSYSIVIKCCSLELKCIYHLVKSVDSCFNARTHYPDFDSLHYKTTGAYIFWLSKLKKIWLRQWSLNHCTFICMQAGITVWQSYILCFGISP